jgi:hypothetical protein
VKEDDDGRESTLKLRKIVFYDRVLKRMFEFLTNLFEMRSDMIWAIYIIRWQELIDEQKARQKGITDQYSLFHE